MAIANDIIALWADLFPVEGYTAGLPHCQGRLFHPTDANLRQARSDITGLEVRLEEVPDADLQTAAGKLLRCFQAQLDFRPPPNGVHTCARGIFTILLKGDQCAPFVADYLAEVAQMVSQETTLWRDHDTPIELCKLCLDSAKYLRDTLAILRSENPDVSGSCDAIQDPLANYEALFAKPGLDSNDFEIVYSVFQRENRAPRCTPEYRRLLRDLYDYPESAEELRQRALDWLDAEMPLVQALSAELAHAYSLPDGATTEQVYSAMDAHNAVGPDPLAEGRAMMEVANCYTAVHILEIGPEDRIEMERTPAYVEPLTTEGFLLSLDYLTPVPRRLCYITPSKNSSRLTMLNVLVHEYGHGFHESLTGRLAPSPLLKIPTPLMAPLTEAIAFHREWEFWEDAATSLNRDDLVPEESDYLAFFGPDRESQRQTIRAFELETRFWRIARFLRVLGDVEVHLGLRSHVDFVEWAYGRTELSKKFIHDATFSFLRTPGYAPCYAIVGMRLGELQRAALERGISRRAFNTRVSRMGYWPRTVYERLLSEEM